MSLPEQVSGFATAAGNFFHFVHSHLTFHLAISFFPTSQEATDGMWV